MYRWSVIVDEIPLVLRWIAAWRNCVDCLDIVASLKAAWGSDACSAVGLLSRSLILTLSKFVCGASSVMWRSPLDCWKVFSFDWMTPTISRRMAALQLAMLWWLSPDSKHVTPAGETRALSTICWVAVSHPCSEKKKKASGSGCGIGASLGEGEMLTTFFRLISHEAFVPRY